MTPDQYTTLWNAVIGLLGALAGAVTVYIALRKMPVERANTESQTVKNLIESNRMLSDDNRTLHKDIDELRAWLTGTIEVVNKIEMTIPPRVIEVSIRKMPLIAYDNDVKAG